MSVIPWIAFLGVVAFLLALDLGVLNRKVHVISTSEAIKWTVMWIVIALAFSGVIYVMYENHWLGIGIHEGADDDGATATLNYLSGYLIEKILSLDNIAVIAMVFGYFKIPLIYQHRVLFWGIIGAVVLRGVMILVGAAAVAKFHWILYVFGVFLVFMAFKTMFAGEHDDSTLDDNKVVKFAKKFMPVTNKVDHMAFFERIDGKLYMTPMFLALLVVESSDVIFAVDSIPAIFVITTDPFIVFTSNIFAILGLRSLYFVLASILEKFKYLKYSVGIILLFVAVKMFVGEFFHMPNWVSPVIVLGTIVIGIWASVIIANREAKKKSVVKTTPENNVIMDAEKCCMIDEDRPEQTSCETTREANDFDVKSEEVAQVKE